MSNLRQAATALLEYLHGYDTDYPEAAPIFNALRAALAEPEQEPVAYFDPQEKGFYWAKPTAIKAPMTVSIEPLPLYSAPTPQPDTDCHAQGVCQRSGYSIAPTPRKPLTDEEIDRVTDQQWAQNNHKPIYAAHRAYARAIERAHGIGEQHE